MNSEFWLYIVDYLPGIVSFFLGLIFVFVTGKRYSKINANVNGLRHDINHADGLEIESVSDLPDDLLILNLKLYVAEIEKRGLLR